MAIFAQVVESGSFTAAGKALDLPRGKVSEQIARLESYTNTRLFVRNTRSIKITEEGQALYKYAKNILPNGNQGLSEISNFSEELKGSIRITTTGDFYDCLLLPILQSFCLRNPEIQLDMVITDTPLSVIDDSIDIAIRSGTQPDSNLISIPLTQTKLKLYSSGKATGREITSPEDLKHTKWIALEHSAKNKSLDMHKKGEAPFSISPNYHHVANSINSYRQLIEHGFGIGLIAEHTAETLVKQGRLTAVLPDWYNQELTLSLIYPHRINMAKRTRLLINEIRGAFQNNSKLR